MGGQRSAPCRRLGGSSGNCSGRTPLRMAQAVQNDPHSLHLYVRLVRSPSTTFSSKSLFHMISPPPSPAFAAPRSKPCTKNENPPLSPKSSSTQHEEDQLSQFEPKCRHFHPGAPPSRRAPLCELRALTHPRQVAKACCGVLALDPLSVSDLENKCNRGPQSADFVSYHAFLPPTSLPDLGVVHPEPPLSSGSCTVRRSATPDAPVYSWPPPIPTLGAHRSSHSSLAGQRASLHSSGEKNSTRGPFLESICTWDASQTEPTKPVRTSENVLQPARARTSSMPSVRRPPEELWRSDAGPTKAGHEIIDPGAACHTPPGLFPRRPELRRRGSVSDLPLHGSVSLSLALGSQPLRASEHAKAVPPIGAERSRVVAITSHVRNAPMTESLSCSSPRQADATMSRQDLERLLCHAVRNKYAPKIISPLSPLRTATPAIDLSADPAYQVRMPSPSNTPSPRYSKCPPRRARTYVPPPVTLLPDAIVAPPGLIVRLSPSPL